MTKNLEPYDTYVDVPAKLVQKSTLYTILFMKILFYFGHPSQFLTFKNTIRILLEHNHSVKICVKSKDVLIDLLKNEKLEFINILAEGRGNSKFAILYGLLKRDYRLGKIVFSEKPDILIGSDPSLAHTGKLFKIACITVLEDDIEVIPQLAKLTYPFTSTILVPNVCSVGKWEDKKIGYNGYMKLAYLHPRFFSPHFEKINIPDKYYLIRLSKLNAYHDIGIKGLNRQRLLEIIKILEHYGKVFISSEDYLDNEFKQYELKINKSDIHHYLSFAELLISDSQSMSVESAILGTPSIRISDFSGKISVLEELEHKYNLTYGIRPEQTKDIIIHINKILSINKLKEEFQKRRQKMLSEKIDVTAFMIWFIENYPKSKQIMKENPDYQYNFK